MIILIFFITSFRFDRDVDNNWIFPDLKNMEGEGSVATKISNFLKDLVNSNTNKNKRYEKVRVVQIPENVSGDSLRTTALNEMDKRGIFPHKMAAVSGHFCSQ